ncbi:MAG: beta-1,6-N-acetylglucosaminyltransferase, partial [Pseudomonadota bacterium]
LLSEGCIPLKPVHTLQAYLSSNPDTDFITMAPLFGGDWVQDGLSDERVTLAHYFSFQRQRFLFDMNVRAQRMFRLRRTLPNKIVPMVGDQWWCLRTSTLEKSLGAAIFAPLLKFMKQVWIPDEVFFQTLLHATGSLNLSPSLTYAEFDRIGKPYVFYDDHVDFLASRSHFFARKVWPGADELYRVFLSDEPPQTQPVPTRMRITAGKVVRHTVNMGCVPDVRTRGYVLTDKRFYVLVGFSRVDPALPDILSQRGYSVDATSFLRQSAPLQGGFRDIQGKYDRRVMRLDPHAFIANKISRSGTKPFVLFFNAGDHHGLWTTLLRCPTAKILFLEDHWSARVSKKDTSTRVKRSQQSYMHLLSPDTHKSIRAEFHIISQRAFRNDPRGTLCHHGIDTGSAAQPVI